MNMKITKANIDEMNNILTDILDDTGQQVREAADVWLDDEQEADDRRDARQTIEDSIDELQGQLEDLLKVIS
jgi:gas vesicle protein